MAKVVAISLALLALAAVVCGALEDGDTPAVEATRGLPSAANAEGTGLGSRSDMTGLIAEAETIINAKQVGENAEDIGEGNQLSNSVPAPAQQVRS